MPPGLVFFFKIALVIWGLFWFHTDFRMVCSSSVKNAGVILIGIAGLGNTLCSPKLECMKVLFWSLWLILFVKLREIPFKYL